MFIKITDSSIHFNKSVLPELFPWEDENSFDKKEQNNNSMKMLVLSSSLFCVFSTYFFHF